jgi:hypothetical protein
MTDPALRDVSDSRRLLFRRHRDQAKRRYLKAVLLLVAAVLAGVVIGVGGALLYLKNRYHHRPPRPDAVAGIMLERMRGLMTLDSDEESRLRIIIDSHMNEVDAIRRQSFGEFRAVIDRMNEEMVEVIGPERHAKWKAYTEKRFGRKHGDDRDGGEK